MSEHAIDRIDSTDDIVYLYIEDDMGWNDKLEYTHLLALQAKLNGYLDYVEAGQLYKDMPEAKEKPVEVIIESIYEAPENCMQFITVVNDVLKESVMRVRYIQKAQED